MSNQTRKTAQFGDTLTKREHHVHELVKAGSSTAEIAKTLGLSRNTAKTYRKQLNRKLGAFR